MSQKAKHQAKHKKNIRTQALKVHKNFDHFKCSLRVSIWGEYSRSLSQVRDTIYTSTE